jgi:thioredoxin-like negative regulator of GroEL
MDVDEHALLASSYGVSVIPTVILFKGGKPAGEPIEDVRDKQDYTSRLDALLQ